MAVEQKVFKKSLPILILTTIILGLLVVPGILLENEIFMWITITAFSISCLVVFSSISIKYYHNKKFRKSMLYIAWIAFFFSVLNIVLMNIFYNIQIIETITTILSIPGVSLLLLSITVSISLISKKKLHYLVLSLIGLALVGFFLKRNHWPLAGTILTISFIVLGITSFGQIISNYSFIKMNRYLTLISTICFSCLTLVSVGFLWRIQHWPGGGLLLNISIIPMILITLIVLLTLPGSKFMEWQKEHKTILSKTILIPWIFFLLLISIQFLLPKDSREMFFTRDISEEIPFGFMDYKPENKNGLE